MTSTVTAEDLSLLALQLLDEADAQRVRQYVWRTPEAQKELSEIQRDLAVLSFAASPQALPDGVRQRFMSAVARERRHPDGFASEREPLIAARGGSKPHLLSWLLPWSGWAVAALLAVSTWVTHQRSVAVQRELSAAQRSSKQAMQAAAQAGSESARAQRVLDALRGPSARPFLLTRQNTPAAPSARLTYASSAGSLVFFANHLQSLPPASTYELWLIPSGKAKPLAAGTFKPDGRGYATLVLTSLPRGIVAAAFGITVERDGGSEIPTSPILLASG